MRTLIVLAVVVLAACSSQPPEPTRYYLLRTPVAVSSGQQESVPEYSLGRVEVAAYIDQPGLVQETSGGEIHMARHHQWAEPLRISLRRFLATEISVAINSRVAVSSTGSETTRIDVSIDQLHGNEHGQAVLVAYWRIIPTTGDISTHQFSAQHPLVSDGYGQLASAERSLLHQLALRIGESL